MVTAKRRRAVGVFPSRQDAEQALQELTDSGFPMERVSVVARDENGQDLIPSDHETRDKVGNKADEGAKIGAISGGALGGLTGLLVGLGTLAIPGIGPIMLAGSLATAIATTLAGAGIGAAAGSLIGSLIGLGIPEERARVYHDRVQQGGYLVIIDGTDEEIERARVILHDWNIEEFGVYDYPNEQHHDQPEQQVATATPIVTPTVTPTVTSSPNGQGTTPVLKRKRAIGVFPQRQDVEAALADLRYALFPMDQVSLIAKDADGNGQRNLDGTSQTAEILAKVPTNGAIRGLSFPGVGPVIAGGKAATAVATELAKGTVGNAVEGIAGALPSLGVSKERVRIYSDRFQRGDFLLFIDGTDREIHQAEAILRPRQIAEFTIFDAPNVI